MATEADERRWREAMEVLDTDTVRAKLTQAGPGTTSDVLHIAGEPPFSARKFIEAWLAEKGAAERKRRERIDGWTLAFAAIGDVPKGM
jgi:hypothetical protein